MEQYFLFLVLEEVKEKTLDSFSRYFKCFVNAINKFNKTANIKMIQCKSINIKLFISQIKKLKSTTKNRTGVTLRLSINIIGNAEPDSPHTHLLTNTQVSNIRKLFSNNSLADLKISKTQTSNIFRHDRFLDKHFQSLTKFI